MTMNIMRAVHAEWLKIHCTKITWITFAAFALAPVMGGLFMLILRNPQWAYNAPALKAKAGSLACRVEWKSCLSLLSQAVGVGGVLVFGFVGSWIFDTEYSDNTANTIST